MIVPNKKEYESETVQFFYGQKEPYSNLELEFYDIIRTVVSNIIEQHLFEAISYSLMDEIKMEIENYLRQAPEIESYKVYFFLDVLYIDFKLKELQKFFQLSCTLSSGG